MSNDETQALETEISPEESASTEMATLTAEGDIDVFTSQLEKKAALAPRIKAAQDAILASQTYPSDWIEHGSMMCLSSAGAERVGRLFNIKFFEVKDKKEDFTDSIGKGYRFVYEGKATMDNRVTFATGMFSTREKFLAFANGVWKPVEDINENNIRRAAYHIFIGNAIKSLLGLRNIPKTEWTKIMNRIGSDAKAAGAVRYGKTTKGGTTQDDSALQKELAEACIAISNAGYYVEKYEGKWKLCQQTDEQSIAEPVALAKQICEQISSFEGKDSKVVLGKPASQLKGKRLEISLKTAKDLAAKIG